MSAHNDGKVCPSRLSAISSFLQQAPAYGCPLIRACHHEIVDHANRAAGVVDGRSRDHAGNDESFDLPFVLRDEAERVFSEELGMKECRLLLCRILCSAPEGRRILLVY